MNQEQSAHITSLHLKGYKSIRDLSVDLKQGLNIIIGGNGSGKTNFLEFLDAAYRSDFGLLLNGRKVESDIKGEPYSVKMKGERVFQSELKDVSYVVDEYKKIKNEEATARYSLNEAKRVLREEQIPSKLYQILSGYITSTLLIRFENPLNEIIKNKLSLNISRHLEELFNFNMINSSLKSNNGQVSFLNKIFFRHSNQISHDEKVGHIINVIVENKIFLIDSLRQNLKQFSPIKDIKIDWALTRRTIQEDEDGSETASIDGIDFQFFVSNEWLNWTQLSDGTKRLFYLIGSVTYADENTIILMEEPELGVHPHQLSLLMNFLKAQSENKQIIITTHAPEVLNCLKANELDRIIVARHEGKAGTKMYKLNEKEEADLRSYMKHEASISDYWLQTGFQIENEEEALS